MKCPSCDHKFPQFASWKLAFQRPLICAHCGAESRRIGKWQPVVIAVGCLLVFNYMIGLFAFTGMGTALFLIAMVLTAMWIDETWIKLTPVSGGRPPAGGAGDSGA